MWPRAALGLAVLACAGCGTAHHETLALKRAQAAKPAGLRIGVVGPLRIDVPGVTPQHGTLAGTAGLPLVLVSAKSAGLATVAAVAQLHPGSHFALVGAATKGERRPNLVGLVLRDDQAARLAGVVAGLVANDVGGETPRVAWVGPQERGLAAAFGNGAHDAYAQTLVLHQWSRRVPARCKEAALTAIGRGAVLVMAHGGSCADAAADAAHQQNVPALRISDFELPSVAADLVARDATAGVYHGGEDIVFGASSGAIAIRSLDPRISLGTVVRARAVAGPG